MTPQFVKHLLFVTAVLLVMAPSVFAGVRLDLGTGQKDYTYPSEGNAFQRSAVFVVCVGPACPEPTPKMAMPVQVIAQRTGPAMRFDPEKVLGREATGAVKQPDLRESISFDFNSATITTREKQKLDKIKPTATAPGAKVALAGYTDKVGSKDYNDRLALSRATSVGNYLGLGSNALKAGKGNCCYLDPVNDAKNRRVEIIVTKITPQTTPQAAQAVTVDPYGGKYAPAPVAVTTPDVGSAEETEDE